MSGHMRDAGEPNSGTPPPSPRPRLFAEVTGHCRDGIILWREVTPLGGGEWEMTQGGRTGHSGPMHPLDRVPKLGSIVAILFDAAANATRYTPVMPAMPAMPDSRPREEG